jgi:hypothetical protein
LTLQEENNKLRGAIKDASQDTAKEQPKRGHQKKQIEAEGQGFHGDAFNKGSDDQNHVKLSPRPIKSGIRPPS